MSDRKLLKLCHIFIVLAALMAAASPVYGNDSTPKPVQWQYESVQDSPHVPEGYELVHNDEFNGSALDTTKWYPYFLPHWSDSSRINGAEANCAIGNGILKLRTQNQGQWSLWDVNNIHSSIQSGEYSANAGTKDALHEFGLCRADPNCKVWSQYANQFIKLAVFKYGYFELRAKAPSISRAAWWMVGFEDDYRKSGEIDVFEFDNNKPTDWYSKCVHFGIHKWDDPNLSEEPFFFGDSCSGFHSWHTYGLLWTEHSVTLYIDGVKQKTINQSPDYEMVTLLEASRWANEADNEFQIEYFRVYKNRRIENTTATMIGGSPGWGYVPARAVDGDYSTYAQSTTHNWDLQVDLRKLHSVDEIVYRPNWANWARNYTIKVMRENGSWTTVKTVTNAGNNAQTHTFDPSVIARYIRFDVTSQAGSYGHAIHELEVYGTPNLAEDKPVSMLNGSPGWGHVPARAVDGDYNSTYAQSTTHNWDLQVDLQGEASVDRIIYRPNWANWARNYTIKVMRENGSWTIVKTVTNAGNNVQTHTFDPPVMARYIRLDVTSQAGSYGHAVHEFEIYGTPE